MIAGPRTDLLEQEVPVIDNYLTMRSGKLLVLFDPPDNLKEPASMPRLAGLLNQWGIKSTDTVVLDVSGAHIQSHCARRRAAVPGARDHQ